MSIVEIGHVPYLKQVWPDDVFFVSVGTAQPHPMADLVLLGAATPGRLPALWRQLCSPATRLVACRLRHPPGRAWALAMRVLAAARPARLIMLDFEDEDVFHPAHRALLGAAHLVFKRELPVDRWRLARPAGGASVDEAALRRDPFAAALVQKLRPLPLGLPLNGTADLMPATNVTKTADVFFAGAVEPGPWSRAAGRAELLGATGLVLDLPSGRLEPAEFYRRCAAARLTWSPAGFGWDCFRHYEAAACGSVPVLPYPSIERHAPLRDGEHTLFYDPRPGGLEATLRAGLADEERLARIAAAGRDWVRRHHCPEAIAGYVLRAALPDWRGLAPE